MSAAPSGARGLAVVTGASSGIGESIAVQLAARGHALVLVARRRDRLDALAARLRSAHGVEVRVEACDLSTSEGVAQLTGSLAAQPVAVLVNNAGYGMQGRFVDMDMAEVERMVRLNVLALTALTQHFARAMAARGDGYILNVSSAAAFLPSPYVSAYAATKSYVLGFTEALRYELRGTGVSVTALYPGITTTEFNAVAGAKTPGVLDMTVLSADEVAAAGLAAMFARRRSVVPGVLNKLNALFSALLPRGFVTWMAGRLLGRANGWS